MFYKFLLSAYVYAFIGMMLFFDGRVQAFEWQGMGDAKPILELDPTDYPIDAGAKALKKAQEERERLHKEYVGEMTLIHPGSFMMGNNDGRNNERPVHRVDIDYGFYMGKYEFTQAQWSAVMGDNPSEFKGDNRPVELISWDDIQIFLERLNQKLGLSGVYAYRLPSEAEWEYAARAGSITQYSFGNDQAQLYLYAWYLDYSDYQTHAVGQKLANPWGLYDMHGNVWEWVADCWNDGYHNAPRDGSANIKGDCNDRILRGGSARSHPNELRSAAYLSVNPENRSLAWGFRLSRTAPW